MASSELQFRKITFTSCCDENDVLEFKYTGGNYPSLVYPNPSLPLPAGFSNTCYQVTITFISFDEWFPLPDVSTVPAALFSKFQNKEADCEDYIFPNGCPECISQCYTLYNCDGQFFNSTNNLEVYADTGQPITIYNIDGVIPGTWYVFKTEGACPNINNNFSVEDVAPSNCACRCFEIVLSTTKASISNLTYIDCDGNLVTNSTATKFCSQIYPVVTGDGYQIIEGDTCIDGICPEQCFKLISCDDENNIFYSNSDSLLPYVYGTNNIVQILNKPGCWKVELNPDPICDCPIEVIVTTSFSQCSDCIPVIAYKLIGCENNDVIYTLTDLEEYVDQVIKSDCGCYKVQQINFAPTNPQNIILEAIYPGCLECSRQHWVLEDCTGESNAILTYTDLSLYEGKVIKIESCPGCWIVTASKAYENATTVVVTDVYDNCPDCSIPTICECTKVTNLNPVETTYTYYDCDNILQTITLQPGESSDKVCALQWIQPLAFCECIKLNFFGDPYYAFIIPGEIYNDYPVYSLCTYGDSISCGYIYYEDGSWVIGQDGEIFWILTNQTSTTCPYGDWSAYPSQPPIDGELTSEECDIEDFCNCFTMTQSGPTGTTTSTFYVAYYDPRSNYPTYTDGFEIINYDSESGCWYFPEFAKKYSTLCNGGECPIGQWESGIVDTTIVTEACEPTPSSEFTYLDHFETFGECKFGNCPQPVFKNNRTVKPGYNTPICSPEKYDKITCKFADILYKIALEKRYGITNCCSDEDDKWLIEKELIDLQALRDPNYKCQECSTCCNNNSCQTCNCKN